jgi:hypothetical protein
MFKFVNHFWHQIVMCWVYAMRQITLCHIEYSEFIPHSFVHLYNSQLHSYCHLQFHNYFPCSHSLQRMLDFNSTRPLHDLHCVTPDHTHSSHTAQLAFYTVPLSCVTAVSSVTSQWEVLLRHRGGGGQSVNWPVTIAAAMLLHHHWRGRGCPA